MAKNLKAGNTVYIVKDDCGEVILYKGFIESAQFAPKCTVQWLAPDTRYKGLSTQEYFCDLYRTPKRAILAYLRRAKRNLEIQADELGR